MSKNKVVVKKVDAWEVNGKFYPVEGVAKEAAQAFRLESLLKDNLEVNLNDQERNTIGWMLLNRLTKLKYIINQFEDVLMKDDEFVVFMDGLKTRAEQIEQAGIDQEADIDEQKTKLLAAMKDAKDGKK